LLESYNDIKIIIPILFGLAILSFLGTMVLRKIALKQKMLDIPTERSSHDIPTPRGGGLAIVITWYIGISVLFYLKVINSDLYFALLSGILLAIISFIDDFTDIKPIIRIIIQFVTAIIALIMLEGINPLNIHGLKISSNYFLFPLTIVGIVWFINLFNFLDGIDGYASIETLIIALVAFIFTGNSINLVLMACVAGFLYWNRPKAKIFMGDVGSTQLGFILVILGIYFHNTGDFSIIHWLMLSSPFWFDATLTLFRRWRNREKLSRAHKKHAYQRIVQAGFSHLQTNLILIMISILIFVLILLSRIYQFLIIPFFLLNILFLYWLTRQADKKKPFY